MSIVVHYYTNYAKYRPGIGKFLPENLDTSKATHIIYSFAVLNADTLKLEPFEGSEDLPQVIDLKRRGVKVLIAIGGWNDSKVNNHSDKYERLFANRQSRETFISHVVNFLQQYGLDGLDLDYEYPNVRANFTQFVRELSAAMKPKGLLLTAAVAAPRWQVDIAYDVPSLANYLDFINLMAYDLHGTWDGRTGHVAPFNEVENAVSYWKQLGMPARKIVLGIPSYGRSFTLSDSNQNGLNAPIPTYSEEAGKGEPGEFTRERGMLAYYEIMKKICRGQMKLVNNDNGAYAYGGNQWVAFDSVDNVKRKVRFARNNGLGGLMLWSPDLDDFNNGSPIASAIS